MSFLCDDRHDLKLLRQQQCVVGGASLIFGPCCVPAQQQCEHEIVNDFMPKSVMNFYATFEWQNKKKYLNA